MSATARVIFAGVGTAKSAAYISPVTWVEVANLPDGCRVRLKPVRAPCAMGDTPTSPVMMEFGTVLTPALASIAKSPAVPRSTAAGLTNFTAVVSGMWEGGAKFRY